MMAVMSATVTKSPAATASRLSYRVPWGGRVVIFVERKLSAGLSLGSLKPESLALSVLSLHDALPILLLVPAGASLTEVTLMVIVLAGWSRSTPLLRVPPSSQRWSTRVKSTALFTMYAGV